jgi:hypothetical protein
VVLLGNLCLLVLLLLMLHHVHVLGLRESVEGVKGVEEDDVRLDVAHRWLRRKSRYVQREGDTGDAVCSLNRHS